MRALAVVVLTTAALSSLGGTAAAEELTVSLAPAHGLPGASVTVNVTMAMLESDPETSASGPFPQATGGPTCEAYWDDDPEPVVQSTCDVDIRTGVFWSASFTVPEDAAEGAHDVEVRYSHISVETTLDSETFTVDAFVVTTTSPEPTPPTTTEPTDDPTSAAAATSSDESISTTNADASAGGPSGIVVIMAALITAGILSWIIRRLRQRSPKWVGQHVRVVAAAGQPQIIESGPRRRPATSVRLEIHRNGPRRERPTL